MAPRIKGEQRRQKDQLTRRIRSPAISHRALADRGDPPKLASFPFGHASIRQSCRHPALHRVHHVKVAAQLRPGGIHIPIRPRETRPQASGLCVHCGRYLHCKKSASHHTPRQRKRRPNCWSALCRMRTKRNCVWLAESSSMCRVAGQDQLPVSLEIRYRPPGRPRK